MGKATEEALNTLHGLIAETLAEQIKEARKPDECGKPGVVPPQLIDKVLKFLKDNGIDAPARTNPGVSTLVDELGSVDIDNFGLPN